MKYYFKHKIESLVTIKSIVTIEYLNLTEDFYYAKEKHDFWEMVYVDCGEIIYEIDDKNILLRCGEILFLKPNEMHSIRVIGKNNLPTIFVICFDCSTEIMNFFVDYKSLINKGMKKILTEIIEESKNTFSMPFKEKLEVLQDANLGGQQVIRVLLELLLIRILQCEQKKTDSQTAFIHESNFADSISKDICHYLENNIYYNINIYQICKITNYSKSFISYNFKATMGISIIDYFYQLKIKEAKKLIKEGELSMTQISSKLHFSDPRYFSVVFKKLTGKSPSEYRNTINKF